jgi:hypothetical protein
VAKPRCENCGGDRWSKDGRCVECKAFPTLGYLVADWIQANCAIPDGERMGEPYVLTDEMLRFLLYHYRLSPKAKFDPKARLWRGSFIYFRGGQLVRPQKWGKGPFSAAVICAEGAPDGPVLFDGWDANGHPVGRPWATPWIQVTAVSEDQTDNVWKALVPMIDLGALTADIPDTGKTRINLPSGRGIEPVTSSARSRLGQPITFALEDETHSWLERNSGHTLADNQRRNLAGMSGRFLSTTNAWDPGEDSVAQRTSESKAPGVHQDDIEPPKSSVRNKAERRKMMKVVYGDSWWVDLDRIDGEIVSLLEDGEAAQAERYFLNRKEAGESKVWDVKHWDTLLDKEHEVARGALIVVGVDGARFRDAVAVVATEVESGFQWPLLILERPEGAGEEYEHDFRQLDGVVSDAEAQFEIWRIYCDDQGISELVDSWQGRWGDKRVIRWHTNRPTQIAWAVRNYTSAINAGDLSHDGDEQMRRHIRNARKMALNVRDDKGVKMHSICKDRPNSPRKIDAAMAGVLSWEARGDAIADGATASLEPLVAWGD